jgi:hypothetical protein
MPYSLLYVSHSQLDFPHGSPEVDDIIAVARARNIADGITGALMSTPNAFAQFLEGPRPAVRKLLDKITSDPRHTDVTVVYEGDGLPRFRDWSMAYSGYASYVDSRIAPLFTHSPQDGATEPVLNLIRLMQEFVQPA